MKCPFLRDANVKYCEASAFRKMILTGGGDAAAERCTSPAWADCPDAHVPDAMPRLCGEAALGRCPYLHEAQAEFCGAAPMVKYIPATNDLRSHCNSDGHLYCELYLAHADPQGERRPRQRRARAGDGARIPRVDGMPVPVHLHYAPNHMWLDVADDGIFHIGLDAFAARAVAAIDRISFLSSSPPARPIAVLSVHGVDMQGVDMQMVFPHPVQVTAANVYLRTAPQRVLEDPYGTGWLFEGFGGDVREGLIDGARAATWFREESERLSELVHRSAARPDDEGAAFIADGGAAVEGVTKHLDRDGLLGLINEFFAPQRTWRRSC